MDWGELELMVFSRMNDAGEAWICLPDDAAPKKIVLERDNGSFTVKNNPYEKQARFRIEEAFQSK
jgi:hypothetical protein